MAICAVCGHDYEQAFHVRAPDGAEFSFDAFECAIHLLAPTCQHCGVRVVGHGVQAAGRTYCCPNCARAAASPPG